MYNSTSMRKRTVIGVIAAIVILFSVAGSNNNNNQSQNLNTAPVVIESSLKDSKKSVIKPTCDGSIVIYSCTVNEISYKTYIYHPEVVAKTHTETVTNYEKKIVSYCTLCSDGTYSPSCATGRGACSHHGGVAQWNAPRYENVPVYSTKKIIDAPAQDAYYEKVTE